mgnify:CR=1 FL=1
MAFWFGGEVGSSTPNTAKIQILFLPPIRACSAAGWASFPGQVRGEVGCFLSAETVQRGLRISTTSDSENNIDEKTESVNLRKKSAL